MEICCLRNSFLPILQFSDFSRGNMLFILNVIIVVYNIRKFKGAVKLMEGS